MVIRASSGKTVDRLIDALWTGDAVARDAAVARLIVIGERALQRLLDVVASPDATSEIKATAFRALEGIADLKALEPALAAIVSGDTAVATAAMGVARALMDTPGGIAAVDRLTAVALDEDQPTPVRIAAARALSELEPSTVQPVFTALMASSNATVAEEASRTETADLALSASEVLEQAAGGRLPELPEVLRRAVADLGGDASHLDRLQKIIEHVRVREGAEDAAEKGPWRAARAAAHAALAQHGSRVALFDLRETFESAREPLAVEFLSALLEIGDASCLEAVAAAEARAEAAGIPHDDWWRRRLAEAFRTIAAREGITRRHRLARKIDHKWPKKFFQ